MLNLTVIMGTRPEIIKLAPIIHVGRKKGHQVNVILTGQHREMALPLLQFFKIVPDDDLDVMTPNQTLSSLSERILKCLNSKEKLLKSSDYLLVQGDTTSAFVASYWGFCHRVPVAHVEAGLRTYDLDSPFPEEANRQLIARIATLHFAPTLQAAKFLKEESLSPEKVHTVGNTGIDSIIYALKNISSLNLSDIPDLDKKLIDFIGTNPLILVTAHRRESFGEAFEGICQGILNIASSRKDIRIVFPVHPNPNVRQPVERALGSNPRIYLCNPLAYVGFVALMNRSSVLLTDSGGIQEEGPTLRKPIIVMREKTERPEGVTAGFSQLVGTDPIQIRDQTLKALDEGLLTDCANPYGDGKASERILEKMEQHTFAQKVRKDPRMPFQVATPLFTN